VGVSVTYTEECFKTSRTVDSSNVQSRSQGGALQRLESISEQRSVRKGKINELKRAKLASNSTGHSSNRFKRIPRRTRASLESRKVIYIDQRSRSTVKPDRWKQKTNHFGGKSDATMQDGLISLYIVERTQRKLKQTGFRPETQEQPTHSVPMSKSYNVIYPSLQPEEFPKRKDVLTDRTPKGEKLTS